MTFPSRIPIRRAEIDYGPGRDRFPIIRVEALDEHRVMRLWTLRVPVGAKAARVKATFYAVCRSGEIDPTRWDAGRIVD